MLEKFIEVYNIVPIVKKGENYFSSDFRFVEHVAEEDKYPSIDKKITELEDILLSVFKTFEIKTSGLSYKYIIPGYNNNNDYFEDRLDALLYQYINVSNDDILVLKERVHDLFYGRYKEYYYSKNRGETNKTVSHIDGE